MTEVEKTTTSADSETSEAGSQTGTTQAGAGSLYRSAGAEVTSDIGQAEAYVINLKKLVADELDHASNLRAIALQALQNAVTLQNRVQNLSVDHDSRLRNFAEGEVSRTVRHSDLAIDRQWNIDEVAMAAISAAIAQAVADAMRDVAKG